MNQLVIMDIYTAEELNLLMTFLDPKKFNHTGK